MEYYTYPAKLVDVIDGDTVDVKLDLGFRVEKEIRLRIIGIDTEELPPYLNFPNVTWDDISDNPDYAVAIEQTEFVEDFLTTDSDDEWPLTVKTEREIGKFGRWLGDIYVDGDAMTEAVLEEWPEAEYRI